MTRNSSIAVATLILSCGTTAPVDDPGPMGGTCQCDLTEGCSGPDFQLGTCYSGQICDPDDGSDAGSEWSGTCVTPRYTVNGDGTVTDDVTGLVWQQLVPTDPCPADNSSGDGGCTWADAQVYCQNLSLGEPSSGWRLPSLPELFSLEETTGSQPQLDAAVFPDTPLSWFWTSSPCAFQNGSAWAVNSRGGYPGYGTEEGTRPIRCVR